MLESKLSRKIRKLAGKAVGDFSLIAAGDRIAVGVSGGKDSYALLHTLHALRCRAPIDYELIAVNIDSAYPGYRTDVIESHLQQHNFTYHMEATECYRIIEEKRRPGTSYCSFCARLRRGALYNVAERLGCNKIALAREKTFPVVSCACPVASCNDLKRQRMKRLIRELAQDIPHIRRSLIGALGNVQPRHLQDRDLWDFTAQSLAAEDA